MQDKCTGRFFIYDNDGKILVFSKEPESDRSKPLIEMYLNEDLPRINPTLFIVEQKDFSILFLIGGYVQKKSKIILQNTILVFKLNTRKVTSTPILTL